MSKLKEVRRKARQRQSLPVPGGWLALLAVGGLVLLAVAAFVVWRNQPANGANFTPAVTGAAQISVDQEAVDLGDVKLGQTVQAAFQVTNIGDQPLRFAEAPYVEVVEGC